MTPRQIEILKSAAHDVYLDPYGGVDAAFDLLIEKLTKEPDTN
jgi:hypothetical protein